MSDSSVKVVHNPDRQRYELDDNGSVIGYADYHPADDTQLVFDHTVVDDAYSGQGLVGKLVRFALDDVRERGKRVVPVCPFVDSFIDKHPEYQDLVA